jgi:hypothetical protein
VADTASTGSNPLHCDHDDPSDALVSIMTNADRLGFPLWRVATALGISPRQHAQIERAITRRRGET